MISKNPELYWNSEDSVAFVPHVDCLPSRAYKRDAKYCSFHCKKEHTLEQRVLFREIFDKKLKTGEFLFKNEGALSIHEIRLPNPTTTEEMDKYWWTLPQKEM